MKRDIKEEPAPSSVRYSAKHCKVETVFEDDNTMLARAKEYDVIEFLDSDDDDDVDDDQKPAVGKDGAISSGTVVKCEGDEQPQTPHRVVKSEEPDYQGSAAEGLAPPAVSPS